MGERSVMEVLGCWHSGAWGEPRKESQLTKGGKGWKSVKKSVGPDRPKKIKTKRRGPWEVKRDEEWKGG